MYYLLSVGIYLVSFGKEPLIELILLYCNSSLLFAYMMNGVAHFSLHILVLLFKGLCCVRNPSDKLIRKGGMILRCAV